MHFGCVELVGQHCSTRSSRRARHVGRVVSCRDVTSPVEFGLKTKQVHQIADQVYLQLFPESATAPFERLTDFCIPCYASSCFHTSKQHLLLDPPPPCVCVCVSARHRIMHPGIRSFRLYYSLCLFHMRHHSRAALFISKAPIGLARFDRPSHNRSLPAETQMKKWCDGRFLIRSVIITGRI